MTGSILRYMVTEVSFLEVNWLHLMPSTIDAYHAESENRGDQVSLRGANKKIFTLGLGWHPVAPLFDVYGIRIGKVFGGPDSWSELQEPFHVRETELLWRYEWLLDVPSPGRILGANPHTQFCGPLSDVPKEAVHVARVLSGLCLSSNDGKRIAIFCGIDEPESVEIATDTAAVAEVLKLHTAAPVRISR